VQVNEVAGGISKSGSEVQSRRRIFLIETLQPLLKMTEFTGILLDWGGNPLISPSSASLMNTLKKLRDILVVSTAFLVFFAMSVYFITQIGIGSVFSMISGGSSKPILGVIVTIIFLIPAFNTVWNIFMFTLIRKNLAKLVRDFHSFELLSISITTSAKETIDTIITKRRNAFIIIISTNFFMFVGTVLVFFQEPQLPIFFTGNETLITIFPKYVIQTVQVVIVLFLTLYQIFADLVPALIYYHAGAAILAIHDEINNKKELLFGKDISSQLQHDESNPFNGHSEKKEDSAKKIVIKIWSKYDRLRKLVKRADRLFGWLLLVDFGIKFFMTSLLSYTLLTISLKNCLSARIPCFFIMLVYMIRLICSVSLMSEPLKSWEFLAMQMSTYLNTYLLDMDTEVCKIFTFFKSEVNSVRVAASPMGLFVISPVLLLTMLSLTVSYLLILIQFQ